jgi:hypothetical protein
MLRRCLSSFVIAGLSSCSGSDEPVAQGLVEARPLSVAGDAGAVDPSRLSRFVDESTGFATDAVHDADREIVHFDASLSSMVSGATGDAASGWSVDGNDLRWSRSGVAFRVQFGTEAGERRAYFTEAGPGTICDLTLAGPDQLFISATSETPPNP